ncbi:class I SAM-dependent methyltransferase [Marilutibacter chinensis]|uniref:Class I SAM-dependent methyltransferase n=1 Tax=Marilutibacter chinensis TaxID=2912247 RepID=A0ABS9HX22_9GAMM|nr:class I SAM-dependent methyltransferase [Lysobacter chinensis]MCF7223121.1 class I SAM-dependent methyltransferase [Lysobacter chinensis]
MTPEQLAAQLRCPSGEHAVEVADRMNEANGPLTVRAIGVLDIQSGDAVLEIGPGNAAFAPDALRRPGTHYTGVDWSGDMVAAAQRRHAGLVAQGRARFLRGSSDDLPFAPGSFDRALAVNTLYFWERPQRHLAAIKRILKPGGSFCIVFGDPGFMRDLPFVPFGFTLYEREMVERLLDIAGFVDVQAHDHHETVTGNNGETVARLPPAVRPCRLSRPAPAIEEGRSPPKDRTAGERCRCGSLSSPPR